MSCMYSLYSMCLYAYLCMLMCVMYIHGCTYVHVYEHVRMCGGCISIYITWGMCGQLCTCVCMCVCM